jgi:His-Xaa-Ser system protein HxsD
VSAHEVTFEAAHYSAGAIQQAVYRFSDRLSCDLSTSEDGTRFRCLLHLTLPADVDAESVLADFKNEVLDQTLRERIRDETREVRNLILALAFSNTGLVEAADS